MERELTPYARHRIEILKRHLYDVYCEQTSDSTICKAGLICLTKKFEIEPPVEEWKMWEKSLNIPAMKTT